MHFFSSQKKAARWLNRINQNALRDRRREWDLLIRKRVEAALNETVTELSSLISLFLIPPDKATFNGTMRTNFDCFFLSTPSMPTGIMFDTNRSGILVKREIAIEKGGAISIGQATTGHIVITFQPAYVALPQDDTSVTYDVTPEQGRRRKFKVSNNKREKQKPDHIIYGVYEPWELSERKLKKIIFRGVRFILNTRSNATPDIYTRWLYVKNDTFYKGIFLGFIMSLIASSFWDFIKIIFSSDMLHKLSM